MSFITDPSGSLYAPKTDTRRKPDWVADTQALQALDANQIRNALLEMREIQVGWLTGANNPEPAYSEMSTVHDVDISVSPPVTGVYLHFIPGVYVTGVLSQSYLLVGEQDPFGNVISNPNTGQQIIGTNGGGTYLVQMNTAYDNDQIDQIIEGAIFVNNVEVDDMTVTVNSGPSPHEWRGASIMGLVDLSASDVVDLRVKLVDGIPGGALGIGSFMISLHRIAAAGGNTWLPVTAKLSSAFYALSSSYYPLSTSFYSLSGAYNTMSASYYGAIVSGTASWSVSGTVAYLSQAYGALQVPAYLALSAAFVSCSAAFYPLSAAFYPLSAAFYPLSTSYYPLSRSYVQTSQSLDAIQQAFGSRVGIFDVFMTASATAYGEVWFDPGLALSGSTGSLLLPEGQFASLAIDSLRAGELDPHGNVYISSSGGGLNLKIAVSGAGMYHVWWQMSAEADRTCNIHTIPYVTDVQQLKASTTQDVQANNTFNLTGNSFLYLSASDHLEVQVGMLGGGVTGTLLTVHHYLLACRRMPSV